MNLSATISLFAATDVIALPRRTRLERRAKHLIRTAVREYAAGEIDKDEALTTIERTLRKMARATADPVLKGFGKERNRAVERAMDRHLRDRMAYISDALSNAKKGNSRFHARLTERTELRTAKQMGAAVAYANSGRAVTKTWRTTSEETCDICDENERAGAIDVAEPFPSGDMFPGAHPGCACIVEYDYESKNGD